MKSGDAVFIGNPPLPVFVLVGLDSTTPLEEEGQPHFAGRWRQAAAGAICHGRHLV